MSKRKTSSISPALRARIELAIEKLIALLDEIDSPVEDLEADGSDEPDTEHV